MLKYVDTKIVFQEVPDEITLAISLSNCPNECADCHSPYLREDIGEILDANVLHKLIGENNGITCLCFMGGDGSYDYINELAFILKDTYSTLKVAWYSGSELFFFQDIINPEYFDYIKTGCYIKERGPLNNKNTNQRMYRINHSQNNKFEDITYKFWRNEARN
jgi:anaerobic ribonucleoside-triphosphate reductase activating protein